MFNSTKFGWIRNASVAAVGAIAAVISYMTSSAAHPEVTSDANQVRGQIKLFRSYLG